MKRYIMLLLTSIFILTSTVSFAAEKVVYYHTDPAGTPLAMTDSMGTVIWQADYRPFGEEQSIDGITENNRTFVGKEKDSESGMLYFGARYLRADIGRFIAPDPVGAIDPRTGKENNQALLNPQRQNTYAYALNSPYKYVDIAGKWPKVVHDAMIMEAFKNTLTPDQITAIQKGSAEADSQQYQGSGFAYMHAMTDRDQKKVDAIRQMNEYIAGKINDYIALVAQGKEEAAYKSLGMALHPLMDSTSPAHAGMQVWENALVDALRHGPKESVDVFKSDPKYMRQAVDLMRKRYDEIGQ